MTSEDDELLSLRRKRSAFWRIKRRLSLLSPLDFLYSADLTALWRRHLVWAKKDGDKLLDIVTGRFGTINIFLSLMFAAEVSTYFGPSDISTSVRQALNAGIDGNRLEYLTGICLILSIIVTGSAILSTFTAIGVFRTLSQENAAVILRSDAGLYAAQLPSRLTIISIYMFFLWLVLFWWVNLKSYAALCMTILVVGLIVHVVSTFSIMSRIIMSTSAMGQTPILPVAQEEKLTPTELCNVLLAESSAVGTLDIKIYRKYKSNFYEDGDNLATYRSSLKRRHPDLSAEVLDALI